METRFYCQWNFVGHCKFFPRKSVNKKTKIQANALFCFMATDKPAEFTKIVRKTDEEKKLYCAIEDI